MSSPFDKWPDYLPGPRDHLLALGVISLSYGQLENMFQVLFGEVTVLNRHQVAALFQRIPNNHRENALLELIDKTTLPTNLNALVQHFVDGFRICAENRHGLVHSHSGGTITRHETGHYGFVFTKYSRAGNALVCTPTLADLQAAADSMHDYMMFAAMLSGAVNSARIMAYPVDSTWLPPSLDKPPLPQPLHWRADKDFRADLLPPESFYA
jgi:hypothetical protein